MTDVSTDTGALREAIRRLLFWGVDTGKAPEAADAILALPALRDLIAERDQAVAAVERVRGVLDALDETAAETTLRPVVDATVVSRHIRRALDSGPT